MQNNIWLRRHVIWVSMVANIYLVSQSFYIIEVKAKAHKFKPQIQFLKSKIRFLQQCTTQYGQCGQLGRNRSRLSTTCNRRRGLKACVLISEILGRCLNPRHLNLKTIYCFRKLLCVPANFIVIKKFRNFRSQSILNSRFYHSWIKSNT